MKVNEIFCSIEGEGIRQGYLCTFVRFYECNLHCSYCDTRYACEGEEYNDMSPQSIFNSIKKYPAKYVTLTGGEPLLQRNTEIIELLQLLNDAGIQVNIETNGSIYISQYVLENSIITMDWKSISSGEHTNMLRSNLERLKSKDVLKFVVGTEEDINQMIDVLNSIDIQANVFVSPVFDIIAPSEIVEKIVKNRLTKVRMQLQIHKFIWDPNKRGV